MEENSFSNDYTQGSRFLPHNDSQISAYKGVLWKAKRKSLLMFSSENGIPKRSIIR
jgi:hypothetical protein